MSSWRNIQGVGYARGGKLSPCAVDAANVPQVGVQNILLRRHLQFRPISQELGCQSTRIPVSTRRSDAVLIKNAWQNP